MTPKLQKYGWKPDHLDHRDRWLPTLVAKVPLPPAADLRSGCPPIYNQGQLGSCTANAIAGAVDFERAKQGEAFLTPSRLFIYYNERATEGTVLHDAGAEIRDGIKSVSSLGVCLESEWPYSDNATQFAVKPGDQCYADALKFKALTYSRVTQVDYFLQHCIAILGRPVVFGFSVFNEFESDEVASTGIVPMPAANETPIGAHAVAAVGYETRQAFRLINSWGSDWGIQGHFWLPTAYITNPNLASDFWTLLSES